MTSFGCIYLLLVLGLLVAGIVKPILKKRHTACRHYLSASEREQLSTYLGFEVTDEQMRDFDFMMGLGELMEYEADILDLD